MSVDILAIEERNRQKQLASKQQTSIINPRRNEPGQVDQISPKTKAQQTLDNQVQIGLGAKLTPMSNQQKQDYANELSDKDRQLMQRYKAEGYSFEASREMVRQNKELADPYAQGINKFKDYQAKEQYYNKTGGTVDPDSTLYKIGTFLQKIGFDDEYGNPLNKLATQYNERYINERQAVDTILEDEEANLLQRAAWWLQRTLLSAESGIITGLGKVGNAVQGVEDIKSSAMDATLDRAILGYDTDLNFYRDTDRRLDEYAWEGVSGSLNTIFWAMAPKMMTFFTALGETNKGGKVLTSVDDFVRDVNTRALENGLSDYYNSLDDQGKEDMLDTMSTLEYMWVADQVNKGAGKLKTTKIGTEIENIKAQNKAALEKGWKASKTQAKAEVSNVKNATNVYNEQGKVIGKMGPEGKVGAESINRIVKAGTDAYKQSFVDRLNARHSGGINTEGAVGPTESVAKPTKAPTTEKGVVGKTKDLATETWDTVITGLTPEERVRIQNDPYTNEKWLKAKQMIDEAGMPLEDAFITEQLYNEVGNKIKAVFDEWENKLGDTSPYYGQIRNVDQTYNLVEAIPEISALLTANDIMRDPLSGELDFTNSKFVSDADMRSVQRALNMIEKAITKPLTPREYLNLRDKLKQLASYATVDASRGQSLIRQLRHTVNEVAHKTIPGLKDLDKVTSKYFNEIAELQDGWVYKGGDRKGELRNNFYSIIKNLTGQNRKVMLDRLEKYYPGVTEEIEAIHIVNKIVKAYNKSPQMIKSMGIGGALGGATIGGGLIGALIGAIVGEMVNKGVIEPRTKSKRRAAIDKLISQLSPEAQRKLEAIAVRQLTAKEISAEDQAILDKVAEIIIQERERGLSEKAITEWQKRTKGSSNPALPETTQGGVVAGDRGFPTANPTAPTYDEMGLGNIKEINKPSGMFSKGGDVPQFKEIKFPSRNLYELATEDPIEKFDGKLTAEQKRQGKEIYQIANKELDGRDIDSDKEIIAARGKFLVMNQKPGYTKALGLDQGKVNESIRKWWEENGGADEKLKQFNRWINDSIEPKYWFTGITNLITYTNPRRNVDAINFLVKDVKGAEDIDTATYKPWIDATIDSLLLMDAHFNHGETNIRFTTQAEMNKYALELAKNKASGEFIPDILTLVAGQGKETIPHEIGHEGDAIIGAELFGMKFIRNSGHSEWFATGKPATEYLRNNGKWHDGLDYKTPEALEFHKEMIDILNDIEIPEWMKNDKSPDSDGKPMSEYRTRPEEVWARFRQANITLTREMNQSGKVPKKTYKSDHGDTYPIELYKRWAQLLQKHQKLVDAGAFYDVEPINRSGISTRNGLRDVEPQKRMTKAEKKKEAMKKLSEIFDNTTILDKKNELVLKNYDPDMQKWVDNTVFPEGLLIDRYETLRNAFKDKKIREGLDIAAEAEDFSEIAKIVKEFIEKPELKWEEPNGEYIRPIRQWFNNHPGITLDSMEYSYSEDPLTWKEKLTSNRRDKVSVQDLKELGRLLKELTQKGTPEFTDDSSGLETFTESRVGGGKLNHLVESVLGGGHETFAENRLKTVGQDTWVNVIDPMLGIVGDAIEGFYENKDNFMKSTDKREEFNNIVLERLGETYRSNVKEWAEEINRNLGYIADDFEYKLKRKNVIPESKLQNLQAKVREIEPILEKGRRSLDSLGTSSEAKMDMRYFLDGFQKREKEVATEATEKVKQLVALSNMDVKNFEKQMKNFGGKSPMPSIAVTDVNVPHTAFGDLTLIFGRETVDPQADPRNKIYASDAWTTTFPTLEKAGGITRELVNRETPKMVERAKENGIDLTDEETKELRQRIGSELLDSSWSEGFYTGWEDMGEMIVDKAIQKAGLDWDQWRENSDAYLRLTFDVASLIRDNQRRDVIPAWYFKPESHVTTDEMENISYDIAKILPKKGIEKLEEDGYDHPYNSMDPTSYEDSYEQGVYSEFLDTIDRLDQFGYTGAEAEEHGGKSMLSKFKDAYGFETKDILPLLEKVWGEIIPERLTHTGFADKLLESTPINDGNIGWDEKTGDYLQMYDKNRQDMNGEIFDISSDLARTLLTQRLDGQLTDEITNKLIDRWAKDVGDTIENRVRVDLREKDGVNSESQEEIEKRDKDNKNVKRVNEIMSGVGASLEDMKLFVRDVINNELLVETVDRSRPVTPENILEAMKNQGGPKRTNDRGTLRDLVGVEGKEFTDIEQVREKNLAKTTHDDRTGDLSDIEHRYNVIVDEIKKIIKDNGNFEASGDAIRENIANSYDADIDKFREKLRDERAAYYEVPDDYLQAIIDAVELGKQVPVRFSEAKPERVVDLYKEVEYILVPKNDFQKVNDIVRGTPLEGKVHMYDRDGFKDARSQRMKNLQARYGNIFFGMGGLVMPIAMLLMMINQEETA